MNRVSGTVILNRRFVTIVTIITIAAACVQAAWVDRTDAGGTITASSQIHEGEGKEMAFDNSTLTKWLTGFTATGWIQFQFPDNRQYTIGRYSIASANDAPERDPRNWTLYGSNDGASWSPVDVRTNEFWNDRFERREFDCATPGAYNIYRLDITANNSSTNLTGFSEMELLENTVSASTPTPANQAQDVAFNDLLLSWEPPTEVVNPDYRVYLSDSFALVQNADPSVVKSQQSETSYRVDSLDSFTTYYWRVNVVDGSTVYDGDIWQFRTQAPNVACLSLLTDINDDCLVGLADLAIVATQWLTESCPLSLCADVDDSSRVDLADLAAVSRDWDRAAETIVLNEIMADNELFLADDFGDYSDWIEIKNLGDTPVNLQGWHLTDDRDLPAQWTFPDVTIDPKGFLLVYPTGRNIAVSGQALHTNFMLDKDGEYLALVRPDLTIAHAYDAYPSLAINEAYGMTLLPGETDLIASLLAAATPGQTNAGPVTAEVPAFTRTSGVFTSAFTVELSVSDPNSQIRYTLNGTVPQESSPLYTGPLTISETTRIRARAFHPVLLPGAVVSRYYLFLDSDLQDFTSDLPIMVIENFNAGAIPSPTSETLQSAAAAVFEPDAISGRTAMINGAEMTVRAGIRRRGRSTGSNPKGNYKLEFRDEQDWDTDRSLLSMPSSSDWVLHAPYYFDRSMIRNAFIHQLSNDAGQYAVRTRYVEMFVNEDGGDLSYADDYAGVYVVMEQIKRGSKRVDITRMDPSDATVPDVTGGYILAIDQADPGDVWFTTDITGWTLPTGDGQYLIKYPQELTVTGAQIDYVKQYIDDLIVTTYGPDFKDPDTGFRAFIDEDTFIDHNLLNMLAKNVDALRLSTYLSKDRNGKLKIGPIWDFDRSMDSMDGRDDAYDTWRGTGDATDYFTHDWWYRFFLDGDFRLHYADRWYDLRKTAFSTDHILGLIDSLAAQIAESQVRNFQRWPAVAPADWQSEVDHLKWWLSNRLTWVDSQMAVDFAPKPPLFNQDGGYVDAGFALTMNSQAGGYTLTDVELVSEGAAVRITVPTDNSLGTTWTTQSFVPDADWTAGSTGTAVGYERSSGYETLINTNVESQMYSNSTSVLCRIEFTHDGSLINALTLQMKYDDGFVAYINGTEVARSANVTNDIPGQADADGHEAGTAYETFDITAYKNLITAGTNVLAIHGINEQTRSSDMLVLPKLAATVSVPTSGGDIWYTTDGSDPRLFGGAVGTGATLYTAPLVIDHSIRIKARSYDPLWSAMNEATFAVGPVAESLRITEMMYHPASDPNSEFIELMNIGTEPINLNLVQFTNGIDFTFPPIDVNPDAYVIVVRDTAAFTAQYPDFTGMIAGEYLGALDNGGERIRLVDAMGTEIHDFDYNDSWYDITDGEGFSLVIRDPAATDPNRWDEKSGWRPSAVSGGSPGTADDGSIPAPGSIVINELLAHSDTWEYDWVELYNTTDAPVNIGGWYLSDNNNDDPNRMKYRIAEGTVIGAYGYTVFTEDQHFGNPADPGCQSPFQFSENGETLYLQSGENGVLTGYYEEEDFGASEKDVAFGRYYKDIDNADFVAMSVNTPGAANATPKVGPVVITEIMYHPQIEGDAEYVELQNISGNPVTLQDPETGLGWRFVDNANDIGVELHFPTDPPVTLAAGEKMLLVKDLAAFSAEFGAPPTGRTVLEWTDGSLSNGGEKPELQLPGDIDESMTRYYIRIDRVSYDDDAPWPTEPDGSGASLNRIVNTDYGNDADNWQAGTPTPGL